jgi:ribosomal protein L1
MAKTKAELLEEAKALGLELSEKNKVAEITAAIADAKSAEKSVRHAQDDTPEEAKEEPAADTAEAPAEEEKPAVAKAGKRSAKALKEAEELAAKEERKASGDTTPQSEEVETRAKKGPKPVTRPKIERRSKKYQEVAKLIEQDKAYNLQEALELATKTSTTKFDASVEVHVVLGVDPRQADQNIRSTVSLPNGTGKTVRVAAFVPAEDADAAKKAGADIAGEDAIAPLLDKEQLDFDVLIATPQQMAKLGKYARVLGPRGLMPNPKSGTVATNVTKAVKEAKAGKVEYRVDKQSIVHLSVGKVSFGGAKLSENAKVFFDSLQSVKPSTIKGTYIRSATITTTMGPGIKLDLSSL